MTDREDPKVDKKSTPELIALPGGAEPAKKKPQEKRKFRDIHYQVASAMAGRPLGWHPFPVKLHRWTDHAGISVPYAENSAGIVKKVSDDGLHHLIATYWDHTLTAGDRPVFLGPLAAKDLADIRKTWLGIAKPVKTKFLTLGWRSEPRTALHKVDFDPAPGDTPLFDELMSRTSNSTTLMAWIGSLFDEHSQRQQYAWIYGAGGNGKSALVRVLLSLMGPVGASENPPTRDAKHWTCGLSNKRLVVFPDCNNVKFVTTGDFKQLTGEDPVRMEPKGKPAYYEIIDAKFLIISNDRPGIFSTKADLRRVLFFSIGDVPDAARVDRYESRLMAEGPAILSKCWETYLKVSNGNSRHEFVAEDQNEVNALVEDNEHELEAFVNGKLNVVSYSFDTPNNARKYVEAHKMIELMIDSGFKSEYERRKLREYMERKHGIIRTKVRVGESMVLVYLNCKTAPA